MKVNHDVHTHTLTSSCCYDPEATMQMFVEKAHELGHNTLGISNHLWDEKVPGASAWYKGQCINYGLEEKLAIPKNTHGIKILFGCETEYCGMTQNLGMLAETSKYFDYVLVPHTHTHMKNFVVKENDDIIMHRAKIIKELEERFSYLSHDMATRMVNSLRHTEISDMISEPTIDNNKYIADFCFESYESLLNHAEFIKMAATVQTIIAHPFHPCGESRENAFKILSYLDRDRLYEDFVKTAKMNVGLDINIGTYRMIDNPDEDPMINVMRIAKSAGCKFAFGTDSHSVSGLGEIRKGDAIADAIGLTSNDLLDIVK